MSHNRTSPRTKVINPTIAVVALLVLVGAIIVSYFGLNRGLSPNRPTSPSAPPGSPIELPATYSGSGSWYTIYFTKPFYPEKPEDRVGGIDAALVADLDAASRSIEAAVFDIDLQSVVDALVRAKKRGVNVRVVADNDANQESDLFASAIQQLKAAGIPLKLDERDAFMHNKFVVIDGNTVWTGSWNWTINDTYRNDNNALRFAVPALAENYQKRFEFLFGDRARADKVVPNPLVTVANGVRIENYFSPTGGAQKAIEDRLEKAQKNIRVMAFSFTADNQAKILVSKTKAGLQVQAVTESRNNEGSGAVYSTLKRGKIDILPDGNCYILHNKIYIIDDQTVITGSYNFTAAAERSNDENLLIIDDPSLAAFYNREFDRVYAQAQNPKCGN